MRFKTNLLLLLAAIIWGFAFVAQRVGMDHIQPFTFSGIRFILGSLSLLPLIFYFKANSPTTNKAGVHVKPALKAGLLAGAVLFLGASFQQCGLVYTTAGKSAFITCLYIILVPIFSIFLKHRITAKTWLSSLIAITGLYLLCIKTGLQISYGDLLTLGGAFFWTIHILLIDHFSQKVDALKLACIQFITCGVLSLLAAVITEKITVEGITQAGIPLLFGGICSVGIAYTIQIIGQKHAAPTHAAIILSMESVFAAIGGYLILSEHLTIQELAGCIFMFIGMLISQLQGTRPQDPMTLSPKPTK
ncbi:MAG: putative superfamily transporter inner rane protein [Firmicutes bacterium]|nr:putative superfamily transporter inner rane protein [Bacillota bacterium]